MSETSVVTSQAPATDVGMPAQAEQAPAVESTLSPTGGVDITTPTPVTSGTESGTEQVQKAPEQVPAQVQLNWEEKARRIQSERDRSEAFTQKVLNSISPWFDIDVQGNISPRITQPQPPSPEQQMQQLADLSILGDRNALLQYGQTIEERATRGAVQEFNRQIAMKDAINETENEIKKDFPGLVGQDGNFDYTSPMFQEAAKIVQQEYKGVFNVFNPGHLRAVIEMAENRRMKAALPDIQKKITNDVMTKVSQTSANVSGQPAVGMSQPDEISENLSQDQLARLKHEGVTSPEDLTRIARMIKRSKQDPKGGYSIS